MLLRENNDSSPMAPTKFFITRVEDRPGRFRQRNVSSVVRGKVVTQFPNALQQRYMRIALRRKGGKFLEKFLAPAGIDSLYRNESPECASHLHIEQMRNNKGFTAFREFANEWGG